MGGQPRPDPHCKGADHLSLTATNGAGVRILLVEDEWLVRATLADEFREGGFEVIEAGSGDEALGVCARCGFDLLVTDIRMPGATNGWDLAEHCRASHPELPVIYISGFSDVAPRPVPGAVMLQKPFRLETFGQIVRELTTKSAT